MTLAGLYLLFTLFVFLWCSSSNYLKDKREFTNIKASNNLFRLIKFIFVHELEYKLAVSVACILCTELLLPFV